MMNLTKRLPADAGRFGGVAFDVAKYDVVGDIAACGTEVPPGPKAAAPVALADVGKLLLDFPRGAPLEASHHVADGKLGRDRDEHVDVIARQDAADNGYAEFLAGLPDDVADTFAQGAAKHPVAVLADPNDVKPMIIDSVFSGVVAHSRLWEMGLHAS